MKNKLKVLILGGSGFIGRNILELLSKKYFFLSPTHKDLDLLDHVSVENYFSKHSIDIVIYSANIGGKRNYSSPPNMLRDNLTMFFNVVKNKKYFKRMIFIGSGAEYDKRNNLSKVRENMFNKYIPIDEYGFYKYICSLYIEKIDNIINLRIFGIFGKFEDYSIRFISNAICKIIYNLPITINQNTFFDYIFIKDFVNIIDYFLINTPKYKFYNIGTGKPIDLVTIAGKINKIAINKQKIIIKKKALGKEYSCNNTLLLKEKKFIFTSLDNSLKSLYDYYLKNKKMVKKKLLFETNLITSTQDS